jgi:hypothetical protein
MNLNDFTKGWLVGDFLPALINSKDVEVGIKYYKKGDKETRHVHKISTEYTIIISGKVLMNSSVYNEKDIVKVLPGEYTDFNCLEDTITLVIKTPSVIGDKY